MSDDPTAAAPRRRHPASPGEELFDVVDCEDRVVGQQVRRVVHREGLLHRAVHIWLFDDEGRLLLQMRSASKDQFPLTWTSSASGHVDAGESYESAARRELEEELGVTCELRRVAKLPASEATAQEFTVLFVGRHKGRLNPDPSEVADIRWWPVAGAVAEAARGTDNFSPPLRVLLQDRVILREVAPGAVAGLPRAGCRNDSASSHETADPAPGDANECGPG